MIRDFKKKKIKVGIFQRELLTVTWWVDNSGTACHVFPVLSLLL